MASGNALLTAIIPINSKENFNPGSEPTEKAPFMKTSLFSVAVERKDFNQGNPFAKLGVRARSSVG